MSAMKRRLEALEFDTLESRENQALLIAMKNQRLGKTHSQTLAEIREAIDCHDDAEADELIYAAETRLG